ncbi:SET domain-containing protein 5 [Colletotrichum spinosum]|uniref:SET domain-containing protein 5 n=1 Tax=Colletotrichum spinosum TaxID=1347390 RepID=A0A4R8Q2Z8_9PEZI|nr:SET domain-containing protein 5 [Colletotrichum spinosum]
MDYARFFCALLLIGRALSSRPFTVYPPFCEKDRRGLVADNDDGRLCLAPGQHAVIHNHTVQRNFSSEGQSSCIWSDNHERQYCVFVDPRFDRGKGIAVITTPSRALHLFNSNGSMLDRFGSSHEPLFTTRLTGIKGRGIFATRHIAAGDLIAQEPPILFLDNKLVEDISSREARDGLQALAISKLPRTTRETVRGLYGEGPTGNRTLQLLINSYGVSGGPAKSWPGVDDESDSGMYAVHASISKINHDCRSNAAPQWDWNLLAHKLYALRDIAVDEEITISYFDTIHTHQERQEYIRENLGFECACKYCRAGSDFIQLSDDRIREILLLESYLESREIAPAEPAAMAELLVSLYRQEGLDNYMSKAYALAAREWNGLGHEFQARSWAYESVKAGLTAGSGSGMEDYVEDMDALLDGARRHWSWKYRID